MVESNKITVQERALTKLKLYFFFFFEITASGLSKHKGLRASLYNNRIHADLGCYDFELPGQTNVALLKTSCFLVTETCAHCSNSNKTEEPSVQAAG